MDAHWEWTACLKIWDKEAIAPKYTNKCLCCILQHNTLHRTGLGTVLLQKLLRFQKFLHGFEERRERGFPTKANCRNTNCCNHCRTLALNGELEHLFPLWWISALTIPTLFTSIFWVYPGSCPEAPNWFLVTGNAHPLSFLLSVAHML